jgi:SAM-dependent methyltransferase
MDSAETPRACDQATLDFYGREAASYVASTKVGTVRGLDDFMQMLPAGGRILELGSGSGRDSEVLLAHGFDVDPTDGSPAMAVQAEQRLRRPVKVMQFDELADIGAYDGVWAHASLLHVPRPALGSVLALVFRALKPGGLHFANYKSGNAAGRDQLDRYYNYPDRQMLMETYLSSARWDILSAVDYVGGSYGGGKTPWIAVTARRPSF